MKKNNAVEVLRFRCTPEERKLLELGAERLNLSISDLLRDTALRRIKDAGISIPVATNPDQVEMFQK